MATQPQEKKGFSSQAKRFPSQPCLNEHPGPGSYHCGSSAEVISPSFSKKGTTGFVPSKGSRGYNNPQRSIPGPNVYNIQRSFINRHDFNTGVSRVFRLPVAVQPEGPKHQTPAPNQYDVRCRSRERFSYVVGTAAFLSKSRRDSLHPCNNLPSPCHYEVKNHLIQHGSKVVSSPFRSKTQRIPAPPDNHVPGPGAYSPHRAPTAAKKTTLPRGFYLALSEPAVSVPRDPPLPGPGQYDIRRDVGASKRPMPTAAFASTTERVPQYLCTDVKPGPGLYDPQISSKQSFIYNDSRIWLPV